MGTLGIEDDPGLVVDEVVCIVGEKWVGAWPGNPGRLRIDQRDFFGRLAATAAARTTIVSVAILLIAASGIERSEVLANRMGCCSVFGQAIGWSPGTRFFLSTSAFGCVCE